MDILDIHTHHNAPQPQGIIAVSPDAFMPVAGQLYSVGIHPWDTAKEITRQQWNLLEEAAQSDQVAAIGECGIDLTKGAPLFRQMQVMKRQIDLSEKIGKPLIIHDVKAHDVIIGLKKELKPRQSWIIHGFRGKPTVAEMLVRAGLYLSFGERFNPESLKKTPREFILAETDESPLTIMQVIDGLAAVAGADIKETVERNTENILKKIL